MGAKDLIIGTLREGGYLRREPGEILLTKIPVHEARSPESGALEIAPEDVGKMALVRGDLSGNVLHSADIIEILSPVTNILFNTLLSKGVVSLEEFQKKLSELESKEAEGQEKKRLCALVIGHKKRSPGAVNERANLSEFDFNEDLARRIERQIQGTEIQRIYRRTYKELPGDINALGPDFIVSLHCNAFDGKVSGTEVLYYYKSKKGEEMAELLLNHLVEHLKLNNRGIKPKSAEDRGGYLLRYTNTPCVIAEPFFIDNDKDLARAREDLDGLGAAYAAAIDEISQKVV